MFEAEELFKNKPAGYEMKPEKEIYIDGFNDGYNKANAELKTQIEKMKCCQNCLHYRHFTEDVTECAMSFETLQDCRHKDFYKWESKEKGEIKNEV